MPEILENAVYFWIAVAVIALIIEAVTYALVTIWFVGGACVALIGALFSIPFYAQVLLFFLSSLIFLLLTRPLVKKKLSAKERTNVDALIGERGIVTKPTGAFCTGLGKVNGQIWTIESIDHATLDVDTPFIVRKISGVRLIVEKHEL